MTSRPLRADGRRNREQIVAAAAQVVARDGAQASLEAIARGAGVGSATLHRHFESRRALLDAVFREGVTRLCARPDEFDIDDPGEVLVAWLEEVAEYSASTRGVAVALLAEPDGHIDERYTCHGLIGEATEDLVARARAAGALREGVTSQDLLTLACSLSAATQDDPDAARRLVRLAFDGART